jgi:hypothetical protein
MRHLARQRAVVAALGCIVAMALSAPSVGREWKSVNNVLKFQGEVVWFDGKKAGLKMDEGGVVFPIPLEKLCEEDQQYLKTTYPNGLKEDKAKSEDKTPDKPKPDSPTPDEPMPDEPMPDATAVAKTNASKPAAKGPAGKAGAASVEVVSLTVTRPPKDEASGAAFQAPGTHITLLVSAPGRTITALDTEKSKITECIDDKRTNLTKPVGENLTANGPSELTLNIGPDGHSGTIELHQPRIPNAAATRIRIRGELHLVCGDGEKTQTVKVPVNVILGVGL